MRFLQRARGRRAALVLMITSTSAVLAMRGALASDHQDTPEVELSPRMDINDVYAFPAADTSRVALVLTTSSPLTPGQTAAAAFDPELLYQIKLDQNLDGVEDRVLQFTFTGTTAAAQRVEVRGPSAPVMTGMYGRIVAEAPVLAGPINTTLGGTTGIQLFAGTRDDPFFLDLEQFFCIVPDRRPATGALAGSCATGVAGSFRAAGAAVDYLSGFNALAIVVELPKSMLRATPGKVGVWATISR